MCIRDRSGDAVKNPQNVYVPVGTKVHEIIDAVGGYKDGVDDVCLLYTSRCV